MSFKLLTYLFIVSMLTSCGKKTEENKNSLEDHLTTSEAEVNFYSMNEVHRSIEAGDTKALLEILSKRTKIDLNAIGHDGETLLTKSLAKGRIEIARILIRAGSDINAANINNETPLIVAVNKNLLVMVEELVGLGADVNKRDIFEDNALILSIKKKNEPIALFLINNGANILVNDRYGRTPYNLAELHELTTVVDVLKNMLEKHFGEPSIDKFREQILDDEFKRIIRTLSRFNHLVLLYEEINPLALLSFRTNEEEMIEGAKLFIRWGAKVDGPAYNLTNPPLIEAMINLRFRYVDFLLDNRASPNIFREPALPPLSYAIELNEPELVVKLLSKGALKKTEHFDACLFVKNVGDEFKSTHDKKNNKKIKKLLSCGFLSWL